MVLELAGARPLDRPVSGVMDSRRELVGEERIVGLEQLHAPDADELECVEHGSCVMLGRGLERGT